MTLKTSLSSQTIIRTSASPNLTIALRSASTSTFIEMKTSAPQQAQVVVPGATKSVSKHPFLKRVAKWADKEYREGYLEGSVEQGTAWQIRAMRKSRGLTQADLADRLGTKQSAVSRMEDPDYGGHSVDTLVKLAHIFDCALSVRFVTYSQLAIDSEDLTEAALVVKSFIEEQNELGA
jgi:transcriptional regulator with XRE-family HTH domain